MPVVVSAASAKQMAEALQPLTDAGIRLRTVMTPAAALAAIARSRRAFSVPDTTEAYVALDNTLTCVALIRNGALVAAHELAWGFLDDGDRNRQPRRREEIAARLGDELAELFKTSSGAGRVTQLCICGGLPELRSTTLPLMERFDVEVEILDSLSGIDVGSLSQQTDEFRERVSELRIAWVAAADWTTINLLRPNRRRASHAALSRAAVVAGVAAGLGSGWSITRSDSSSVAAASSATTPIDRRRYGRQLTPSRCLLLPRFRAKRRPPPPPGHRWPRRSRRRWLRRIRRQSSRNPSWRGSSRRRLRRFESACSHPRRRRFTPSRHRFGTSRRQPHVASCAR